MSAGLFDLGLGADDEAALREARRRPLVVDRDAVLRLIAEASGRVDAAVRRRPVFKGAPFTLPGHVD
jgi:hypothetical protein